MLEIEQLYKNRNDGSGKAINDKENWIKEFADYLQTLKVDDWSNIFDSLAEGETIKEKDILLLWKHDAEFETLL